jgi:head-tail adaptor
MTLNEIVRFYNKADVRAADGSLSPTRTLLAKAYAKVRPMSGSERSRSDGREDFANYRFFVHQRSDIGEADVIVWNSIDYNISFIADNGPKEPYMYIDAERGGAM